MCKEERYFTHKLYQQKLSFVSITYFTQKTGSPGKDKKQLNWYY